MKDITACDFEHFSALYTLAKVSLNMTTLNKEYASQLGNLLAGATSKELLDQTTPDIVTSYSYSLFELLPINVLNEMANSSVANSLNTNQASYIVNYNKNFDNIMLSAQNKYNQILDPGFEPKQISTITASQSSEEPNYALIFSLTGFTILAVVALVSFYVYRKSLLAKKIHSSEQIKAHVYEPDLADGKHFSETTENPITNSDHVYEVDLAN
jgi:hypothetical protein